MSILDQSFALISRSQRVIGAILPEITIRETLSDDMIVTDHPVELGAPISDHAFLRPKQLELIVGWSECTGGMAYTALVYQALLALQSSRMPFFVITKGRFYRNMLIVGLQKTADQHTDNILLVSCRLREVILTSTQGTGIPASAQANPASTASGQNVGQMQAQAIQADPLATP